MATPSQQEQSTLAAVTDYVVNNKLKTVSGRLWCRCWGGPLWPACRLPPLLPASRRLKPTKTCIALAAGALHLGWRYHRLLGEWRWMNILSHCSCCLPATVSWADHGTLAAMNYKMNTIYILIRALRLCRHTSGPDPMCPPP
jgi:hypothetical protein